MPLSSFWKLPLNVIQILISFNCCADELDESFVLDNRICGWIQSEIKWFVQLWTCGLVESLERSCMDGDPSTHPTTLMSTPIRAGSDPQLRMLYQDSRISANKICFFVSVYFDEELINIKTSQPFIRGQNQIEYLMWFKTCRSQKKSFGVENGCK